MSEPFLGEIRMVGFNFAPRGWAFCDGQILPINQNQSLYSLLGTTYGGDGRTSFALPDLRSRTSLHKGDGYQLGQKGGVEAVTLTAAEMAAHTHTMQASPDLPDHYTPGAGGNRSLAQGMDSIYSDPSSSTARTLNDAAVTNSGGGQAHNNMQPSLVLSFCIALQGLFPSRN
ncbi:phage tail protein [Oceanospirillum maris]|jgi:microcystin-dependent protein|uniref:phage tail protein n=1 Tax=Oceanospirillum maris TaxID=64977 RepID=UPI00041BF615|nr:tail fiber protein [Oceanospirillum maris]